MRIRLIQVVLALSLMACVGVLCVVPAFALPYGPSYDLGDMNTLLGTTGIVDVWSLTYAANHEVYGCTSGGASNSRLFVINFTSGGGYYPLPTTAVTPVAGGSSGNFGYDMYTLTAGHPRPNPNDGHLPIYGGTSSMEGPAIFFEYDIDGKKFTSLGNPLSSVPATPTIIYDLTTGTDGKIYGGTGDGTGLGYFFGFDPATRGFINTAPLPYAVAPDNSVFRLATGIHGEIYFISLPSGTLRVYEPRSTPTVYTLTTASPGLGTFSSLTVDTYGTVWIGTNTGCICRLTYGGGGSYTLSSMGKIATTISGLNIWTMTSGSQGRIYVGFTDGVTGYYAIYDQRKQWSAGPSPSPSDFNPYIPLAPVSGASRVRTLVTCDMQDTIFGGTGLGTAHAFYYYEGGVPDTNNDGLIDMSDIGWAAMQYMWDAGPQTRNILAAKTLATTVKAFGAVGAILTVRKRKKKEP